MLKNSKYLIVCFFVVYLVVMLVNDGFMATDEYFTGITRYIPAQAASVHNLVNADDVKSPAQIWPMFAAGQVALLLGIHDPYPQYRFVIFLLGLFNLALLYWALSRFADWAEDGDSGRALIFAIFTFYFAAPFAFTRPMFESMATPWLALAATAALRYDRNARLKDCLEGVAFISMAFLLRPQVGFCALIFVILPLMKKKWKALAWTAVLGALLFALAGLPDLWLRGQWHQSLLAVFTYNFAHGSDYGRQPISFYPSLILVITFSPFFIAKYGKEFLSKYIKDLRSLWILIFLFVFLHSLFAQKWERFLIPLIPILLFAIYPLLRWQLQRFSQYRWRLTSLIAINMLIFFVASFFPPQKNLIGLSIFLNGHPEIKHLFKIDNTPEWITDAFILGEKPDWQDSSFEKLGQIDWKDCRNSLVLSKAVAEQHQDWLRSLNLAASFPVNAIESLAYRLNPKRNPRRVELEIYTCKP